MAESIKQRLDRVLDHVKELGASAKRIVLSGDDFKELQGDGAADTSGRTGDYRDISIEQGQIGQSSYVEAEGAPSGDVNFGV